MNILLLIWAIVATVALIVIIAAAFVMSRENLKLNRQLGKLKFESEKTISELNGKIDSVEYQSMADYKYQNEELQKENEKLLESIEESKKLQIDVEKHLSNALHESGIWGFPNSMAFPGCTSIASKMSRISDDERWFVLQGRTLFDVETSQKIIDSKTNSDRYNIALLSMKKQGIFDKIVKDIIMNNAVEYTFGVLVPSENESPIVEIYYRIQVKEPESVIQIKNLK